MEVIDKPHFRFKGLSLFFLTTLFVFFSIAQAWSQATPAPPASSCDPEYMDALEARAYLEAQREITQNQNLILKPDSVFELTCFDLSLYELANRDDNFSESEIWGTVTGQGPGSLDLALAYIHAMAGNWVYTNFGNVNYLADRGPEKRLLAGNMAFLCGEMRKTWDAAQCMNFFDDIDNDGRDGFYDFPWYTANEPRLLPTAAGNQYCPAPLMIANEDMDVAFNYKRGLHALFVENPWPSDMTPYTEDPIVTYLQLVLPQNHPIPQAAFSAGGGCAPPILTGICVARQGMTPYADAVCPNPGCRYDISTSSSSTTCGIVGNCVP